MRKEAYFTAIMARTVKVDLAERSYDIHIGAGLLKEVGARTRHVGVQGHTALLVSDKAIAPLYAKVCVSSLKRQHIQIGKCIIPSGETSKDKKQLFRLYDKALKVGLDRNAFVVALGGGVVGDLAGFMAATYLRGIPYVQVPTTLLAMVDSAVGGKTGINLPQGKNLIGSFHQPSLVIADTDTLKSLPKRELVAGLAEVIKYGVIWDAELFHRVKNNLNQILALASDEIEFIVERSCQIKAAVVSKDEREGGLRAILNFGHTVGHAIEAVEGYGKYLHGEAISVGMVFAARLSVKLRGFPPEQRDELIQVFKTLGLPTQASQLTWEQLRAVIEVDKKTAQGKPKFVLADKLGTVVYGCDVSEEILSETWKEM